MNRRLFISGAGALALVGGSVSAQVANTCIIMEEREGAFVLEGTGKQLTEPFTMAAGVYRIEVELTNPSPTDVGFWMDFIIRDGGEDDDSFIVSDSQGVPELSSGTVEFSVDGEYLAEQTKFRGDWKVVLSPI